MRWTRRGLAVAITVALVAYAAPALGSAQGMSLAASRAKLNELGCNAGPATGHATRHLASAVMRFQSRVGLRRTGRLNDPTASALAADSGAQRCDVRPVPAGTGSGRRVVVSYRQSWIWLIGPAGRVVAQAGVEDNPKALKPGSYVTGSYCGRAARIRENQDETLTEWLDNFVRFAPCGFGFHRIPRLKTTGQQVSPNWQLGTRMASSDGCIRLSHAMSKTVWDFTDAAPTRVVIAR